jgi:protein SCO1
MKKFLFLLSILAIPALVFVFLRFFGDNTFEVNRFYQVGGLLLNECDNVVIPYKVDLQTVKASPGDKAIRVIAFATMPCELDDLKRKLYHLGRIYESLDGRVHNLILLKDCAIPDNIWEDISVNKSEFQVVDQSTLDLSDLNCLFLLNEGRVVQEELSNQDPFHLLVLLDAEGIIRGYYDGLSAKDTDRLLLEARILLK